MTKCFLCYDKKRIVDKIGEEFLCPLCSGETVHWPTMHDMTGKSADMIIFDDPFEESKVQSSGETANVE